MTLSARLRSAWFLALLAVPPVARAADEPAAAPAPRKVDFRTQIVPILRQSCVDCHNATLHFAGLRFDRRDLALKGGDAGRAIRPGKSAESLLVRRLTDRSAGIIMPPSFPFFPGEKPGLPQEQIDLLKAWIDQGAEWPEDVAIGGAAAESPNDERLAALFSAIRRPDRAAAHKLAADKTLINRAGPHGETPLIYAARCGDADTLRALLERGAEVDRASASGATALIYAAGDLDKVAALLEKGAEVNVRTRQGRTPLLVAATYAGNLEVIRLLLDRGAKIDDRDEFGETVLTSASKRGDVELVKALIAAGADLHAGARPPLVWAAEEGGLETIACLLEHGAAEKKENLNAALATAAIRGPHEAVRLLLEHGGDPNAPAGLGGYTALLGAAYSENASAETVQMLLNRGADVRAKGPNGSTPLALAKKRGRTNIVEILVKAGATE